MPIFNMAASNKGPSITIGNTSWEDTLKSIFSQSDYVSADEALKNSDVFSLIMQLSGDLAAVDYQAKRPVTQNLLDDPSNTSNAHAFWQSMFAQLLLGGEAFAYRWRDWRGQDIKLEYLRPSQVSTMLLNDGSGLVYNLAFDEPNIGIKQNVPQYDVLHFRLLSKNGGKTGISPLSSLANELNIKQRSNNLTLHALSQSIVAPGILSVKNGSLLDNAKKAAISNRFAKQMTNSTGPIVLDDLEKYQPLEIKADVSRLLSQADWTSSQIAKVYGISDSYLNGAGDQQSSIKMITDQYGRSLKRYTDAITSELSNKFGQSITADLRPALDPNGDDYAAKIADLRTSDVLDANQAQEILVRAGYLPNNLPARKEEEVNGGN